MIRLEIHLVGRQRDPAQWSPLRAAGLWFLTHERHRDTPRIRVAMDFLDSFIKKLVKSRLRQSELEARNLGAVTAGL